MNEMKWLDKETLCLEMLPFLDNPGDDDYPDEPHDERKSWLYAAACGRKCLDRASQYSTEQLKILHDALDVVVRFADYLVTPGKLAQAKETVSAIRSTEAGDKSPAAVVSLAASLNLDIAYLSGFMATIIDDSNFYQSEIIRDIIGNPWRPLLPRWFPGSFLIMAQAAYDGDKIAIKNLADKLEEFDEIEAATHLRHENHVKGCYVIDWVLGKPHFSPARLLAEQRWDMEYDLNFAIETASLGQVVDDCYLDNDLLGIEFRQRLRRERGYRELVIGDEEDKSLLILPDDDRVKNLLTRYHHVEMTVEEAAEILKLIPGAEGSFLHWLKDGCWLTRRQLKDLKKMSLSGEEVQPTCAVAS